MATSCPGLTDTQSKQCSLLLRLLIALTVLPHIVLLATPELHQKSPALSVVTEQIVIQAVEVHAAE